MAELNVKNGAVTYTINGKGEVSFNPTDADFINRMYSAFDAMEKKQDAYSTQIRELAGTVEMFDFARRLDEEMRGVLDELFQAPISEMAFGGISCYALADGLPLWCNLMLAVMDEINNAAEREKGTTKMNEKVNKYLVKYQKQQKK